MPVYAAAEWWCDYSATENEVSDCGEGGTDIGTTNMVKARLREQGWKFTRDGKALCPDHTYLKGTTS